MPFSDSDLQQFKHLVQLDRRLAGLGADAQWDLRSAGLVLHGRKVRVELWDGRWIYRWGPWPGSRVDAIRDDAVARVFRGLRRM